MSLFRALRRDISKEFYVSRNLGESWGCGCLRFLLCVSCLLKAVRIGLCSMGREQIGSTVIYGGRRCFISNWAGSESPTLAAPGFYREHVPRSEIRNVVGVRELWHRFSFGVEFYTGYHMDTDINKRLYPTAFAIRE